MSDLESTATAATAKEREDAPVAPADTGDNEASGSENEGESDDESVPLFEAPTIVSGRRQRKKPAKLLDEIKVPAKAPAEPQSVGNGERLGNNPAIEEFLTKHRGKDLEYVHRFLFGTAGTRLNRKKDIREFCGFPDSMTAAQKDARRAALAKRHKRVVTLVAQCLNTGVYSGSKDAILDALMAWAELPTPSTHLPRGSGKSTPKRRKSAKKGSKGKNSKQAGSATAKSGKSNEDAKPQEPLTAFQLFMKEVSAAYRDEHPEASAIAVTKALKQQWKDLDDDERQMYEDAHVMETTEYKAKLAAWKKSGAKARNAKQSKSPAKKPRASSSAKGSRRSSTAGKTTNVSSKELVSSSDSSEDEEESADEHDDNDDEADAGDDASESAAKDASGEDDGEREDNDDDDDSELAPKKAKLVSPSNDDLVKAVYTILEGKDLQEMTKKKVLGAVKAKYPNVDIADKKAVIVDAVASFVNQRSEE